MKRIIIAAILIVFLFILGSCGQTMQEEFLIDFNDGATKGEIDFNGYDCKIIQDYDLDHPFQYPVGTLMADMYLKRLKDISDEFNCKVYIEMINGTETARIASNLYVGEIACTHDPSNRAKDGMYYRLDVLKDHLDYTNADKFGSPGLLEQGMFNGVPYAVSPVAWPGKQMAYVYNILAINENTVTKYVMTDPRDYFENGEWTWDTFDRVLPEYQVYDGEFKSTALNLTWTIMDFAMMNGIDFVSVDVNGELIPNLTAPEVIETFDWCSKLMSNHFDCISYLGHYEMVDAFISGELTLAQTSFSHMINEMIYDVDNYGVVPFPCGPNGTYGKWINAYSGFDSMSIWVSAKEPEAAATVIDRMFEPFEGYETLEDIQRYAYNIFYDKSDVELFTTYLKYSRWNYYTLGIWDYFVTATNQARNGKTGAEIVDKFGERANELVERYVIPNTRLVMQLQEEENS